AGPLGRARGLAGPCWHDSIGTDTVEPPAVGAAGLSLSDRAATVPDQAVTLPDQAATLPDRAAASPRAGGRAGPGGDEQRRDHRRRRGAARAAAPGARRGDRDGAAGEPALQLRQRQRARIA